ncbi:hypothetical protein BD289DRAFT_433936 [Coniella lustricola]|uniref:Defect at low temperature protein 1 n=1 Tax=Coniella lustricola TaxID=2025994 RepID=A0A2T3A866_9PEZI|nr:hypothetical protein BD289DRAFT_433936 [Coniella lustricola]
MSRLHTLWRFVYHSLYYFLALILTLLLCVTPADALRQSILNSQRYHILTIIVCLSVTLLAVACIYIFRFYVMRTALANIPKSYIPIEKGEVPKDVRKVIIAGLSKSAVIAYESKPRIVANARPMTTGTREEEDQEAQDNAKKTKEADRKFGVFGRKKDRATTSASSEKTGVVLPPHKAVWGEIEHNGWASPNSLDLPNLQYSTVVLELPNLIEAKALTLAPPAPGFSLAGEDQDANSNLPLDPDAIALLQRPDNLSLRQYLAQLAELGVLAASRETADFLISYEYARYSTRPLSDVRFRELMHLFAEILRAMQPLDLEVLAAGLDENDDQEDDMSDYVTTTASFESDIDNDAPRESPSTPRSRTSRLSFFVRRHQSNASRATTGSATSGGWRGFPNQMDDNSNNDDDYSIDDASSQIHHRASRRGNSRQQRPNLTLRQSSQGTWTGTYRTAPMTPGSRRTGGSPASVSVSSRSLRSVNSSQPARQSFATMSRRSLASSSSGGGVSMRSVIFGGGLRNGSVGSAAGSGSDSGSGNYSGNGSVIRLNDRIGVGELPYVLSDTRHY